MNSLLMAQLSYVYTDAPDTGFFDPTPVEEIGGNPGTTLGEQRQLVLQRAGEIWTQFLDIQGPVEITASFLAQQCDPSGRVLASAGPVSSQRDFPGAIFPNVIYPAALVNHLAKVDRFPGRPEILVRVNSRIDSEPNCGGEPENMGRVFYYGFDGNSGSQFDLLETLTHEIGHGLGMASFVNESTGSLASGFIDIYSRHLHDTQIGLDWKDMTDAQRAASAVNDPFVVWNGENTTAALGSLLAGTPALRIGDESETFILGTATFGPAISSSGLSGQTVLIDDGTVPVTDGCEEPFLNALAITGNIALIDRGTCNFDDKVQRAQDAGAIGVIIINNVPDGIITMSGDTGAITIPSVMVTQATGLRLRVEQPEVKIDFFDLSGTNEGLLRVHAPNPIQGGSSISHWSSAAFPNLLMEPSLGTLNRDDPDLALTAFRELGWTVRDIPFPNTTYDVWAEQNISSVNTAKSGDADGDGITNFEEYVQGSDPDDDSSGRSLDLLVDGDQLSFTRTNQATDLSFSIEQSLTLDNDFVPALGVTLLDSANQGEQNIDSFQFTIDEPQKFFRLKVE